MLLGGGLGVGIGLGRFFGQCLLFFRSCGQCGFRGLLFFISLFGDEFLELFFRFLQLFGGSVLLLFCWGGLVFRCGLSGLGCSRLLVGQFLGLLCRRLIGCLQLLLEFLQLLRETFFFFRRRSQITGAQFLQGFLELCGINWLHARGLLRSDLLVQLLNFLLKVCLAFGQRLVITGTLICSVPQFLGQGLLRLGQLFGPLSQLGQLCELILPCRLLQFGLFL